MMKVEPMDGWSRFIVTGESFTCSNPGCEYKEPEDTPWEPGEVPPRCKHCGKAMNRSVYLVDVAEYDGNGQCNCEDFECRRGPLARARMELPKAERDVLLEHQPARCKHIVRARRFLLDEFVKGLGKQEKAKPTEQPERPKREYVLHR